VAQLRPPRRPPRQPPPPRQEPDWHPALASLTPPEMILFDWHATLVDTLDAMYHAVDDLLPELRDLGLTGRLVQPAQSRSPEDQRLVEYVRERQKLHPKVKADRKISRTDIFEVLFGEDSEAKRIAHAAFNRHYRKYFGKALPFEPKVREMLEALVGLGFPLGIITNRDREFFVQELGNVAGEDWSGLFRTAVCGDDTPRRKPHTDQLEEAVRRLGGELGPGVWYVGDSTTDTIAARAAGVTSVFFNGAQWDLPWLNKIFPGSRRYPHRPDVVVNDFAEFWALVLACRQRRAVTLGLPAR
jgi:phosphoglycolate phosphatase